MTDILVTDSGFARYQPQKGTYHLSLEEAPEAIVARLDTIAQVHIPFASSADGRGFSYARRLRELGYQGQIIAVGAVLCDQYRQARQSGFDAVLLSDKQAQKMPEPHWQEQARRVPISYRSRIYA